MAAADDIRRMEKEILSHAADHGANDIALSHIRLALEELLTNIRLYAYREGPGRIVVNTGINSLREGVSPESGRAVSDNTDKCFLHLEIIDWGPAFNPLEDSAMPDLESGIDERPVGGLGVHLVRQVAASVTYARINRPPPLKGNNRLYVSIALSR
jgi:anti-sigma regulatory factor (Ser/Thr protein kinase)